MSPLNRLRHHVSGAIARGEAVAIVARTPLDDVRAKLTASIQHVQPLDASHNELVAMRDALDNPGPLFLAYCEAKPGEFWHRLAGSVRKAISMV